MKVGNVVELFCGYGVISDSFKKLGFEIFTTDIRKRKGVCEPDLRKDILELRKQDIPFEKVHVLWASPPCDIWSYASGSFHWTGEGLPKTEKSQAHIKILMRTLELIEEITPDYFFIENPRGRMRRYPPFVEWLEKHNGVEKTLTYSSYGFKTVKPTNIFTNLKEISFKDLDRFGRGAKNKFKLENASKCQKQKVPQELSDFIAKSVQDFL